MDKRLKIGIGSYAYAWAIGVPGYVNNTPMSAFDLIERASNLKAEVVQFADNMPLENYSKSELSEILLFAQKRAIAIEIGAKGIMPERLDMYIQIASFLKAELLRFVVDNNGYTPSLEMIVKSLRQFIPILKKNNIHLALENHDRLACADFTYIIDTCNSPNVGICLDTVNSLGVPEGTEEVINALLPYTFNLHVKDFSIDRLHHKMGFIVEGKPAGEGKLNIPVLFRKLLDNGKCQSAILELWTPFGPTLEETISRENEWVNKSMKYLQQLSY